MSIVDQLASSKGRRDEVPNQQLANKIVNTSDAKAIQELIQLLGQQNKNIQGDVIKVLYEIGYKKPELISGYIKTFIDLLNSKNNRMQWGAMMAIQTIVSGNEPLIFKSLPKLIATAEKGSVISRDQLMKILSALGTMKKYNEAVGILFNELLMKSPTNQFPMYAELALPVINDKNKPIFVKSIQKRLTEIDLESKKKRIEKVLKQLKTL